jgi:hypothetical protein
MDAPVVGRYKLSATQQAEVIKMIRLGAKSQAEIAELFNVDRSHDFKDDEGSAGEKLVKAVR